MTMTAELIINVTRVGVTRGGNWWCQPIFSIPPNLTIFLSQVMTFLAVVSSPLPPLEYRVLSKFSHKNNKFYSGVTPLKGVTRGGPPPSDATA